MIANLPKGRIWAFVAGVLVLALLLYWALTSLRKPSRNAGGFLGQTPGRTESVASGKPAWGEVRAPAATDPRISHPSGHNAADFYKNAFVMFKALSEDDKKILHDLKRKIDPSKDAPLLARIQPMMELLRRAKAEGTYTDWGVGPLRFDTPLPHLSAVQELGKVVRWDATYRFAGDPAVALDDLAVQERLGDSVRDQAMIGTLVGMSLDKMALRTLHDNIQNVTPDLMGQTFELVSPRDGRADLANGMASEVTFMKTFVAALLDPAQQAALLPKVAALSDMGETGIKEQLPTIAEQTAWLAKTEEQFAAKALLPDSEYNVWWAGIQQSVTSHSFASLVCFESQPASRHHAFRRH